MVRSKFAAIASLLLTVSSATSQQIPPTPTPISPAVPIAVNDRIKAPADLRRILAYIPSGMQFFSAFRGTMPTLPPANGTVDYGSSPPQVKGQVPDPKLMSLISGFKQNTQMLQRINVADDWKSHVIVSVIAGRQLQSSVDFGQQSTFKGCNIIAFRNLPQINSLDRLLQGPDVLRDKNVGRVIRVRADAESMFYVQKISDDSISVSNDLEIALLIDEIAFRRSEVHEPKRPLIDELPAWVQIPEDAVFTALRFETGKAEKRPNALELDSKCRGIIITWNGKADALLLRYRSEADNPSAVLSDGLLKMFQRGGFIVRATSDRQECNAHLPFRADFEPLLAAYVLIGFTTFP